MWLIPLIFVLFMAFGLSLIFYPMMHMKAEGLPVAVASYDAGVQTPQGKVDLGDKMADKLVQSGKKDHAVMVWTRLDNKAAVQQSLDNHDYYATVAISKDFTAKTLAAKQAQAAGQATGQAAANQAAQASPSAQQTPTPTAQTAQAKSAASAAPAVDVTIDNGKSPMVATVMQSALAPALEKTGVTAHVKTINTGYTFPGAMSNASMIGQNAIIIPTYVLSMLGGMLTATFFASRRGTSRKSSWKNMFKQLVYLLGVSLIVSLAMEVVERVLGGTWMNAGAIPFFWLCSFAVMTIVMSVGNIAPPLGQVVGMLVMFLGISSAMFPPEMLPTFWHKWLYPWVPHHFIGDGYRAIFFDGDGFWNSATGPMFIYLAVGIVLFVFVGLLNAHRAKAAAAKADAVQSVSVQGAAVTAE